MGRIALLLLLVASPAFAQPAPAPPPAPPPPAPPPTAPPPTAPALQRAKCQSNLYLEPTLLVGRSRKDGIGRLHGAGGFRYSRCPTDGPESFRVHLGFFVQVGSEEVGDAFTKGGELEYNTPFREGRIGGRAYYGTANHGLYIIGGGVRFRQASFHIGFEMIYSSRSTEGQAAAVAGLAAFGLNGKPGAIAVGVMGLLALLALSQFNTT